MNKYLKFFGITLAFCMVISGCGKKEAKTADENPVISWYMLSNLGEIKPEIEEMVENTANEIIKKETGATLDLKLITSASWEDKIKLMAASGDPYDLVLTSDWTNKLTSNVEKGAFLALDDLVEKYGSSIKEKVDERAWKAVTYSGKIMAVPSQGAYAPGAGFVFRKDLVEKYNIDYKNIHSLKDLEPYLELIKKNEPDVIPLLASSTGTPGSGDANFTSIGGGLSYNEIDKKIESAPRDNLKLINEFYKKGYIAKDAAVKTDFMSEAKSGKYAVLNNSGGYSEDGSKATAVYGYPCVESFISYPYITTSVMTGSATAISRTSQNPEKAMEVLNLVWKDPYLSNMIAYGPEGKNFDYISGKGTDNPKVEVYSGDKQVWGIPHNFLGPLFDQWDSNWNSREALEVMKKNNHEAKASDLLGFVFDTAPVKNYIAQVSAISTETKPVFQTGSMSDFDAYAADYDKRVKAAGYDKIVEEAEKQIAKWKAENKK